MKEEVFKAFLTRKYVNTKEIDGLIKRRSLEADIFVNDNWMPFPSKKYKNDNEYINYFKNFLKTGILPLFFLLTFITSCNYKNEQIVKTNININQNNYEVYQKNDLLNDINDVYLNKIDTILNFSDKNFLYILKIKKEQITLKAYRWKEAPDGIVAYQEQGIHKNGYIYIKNKEKDYKLQYKIILNKGLFYWNDNSHWELINSGDY